MREIKFRGKRLDNDEWVYGFLSYNGLGEAWIRFWSEDINSKDFGKIKSVDVDIESVGEFTGLKDKNGKEIYEGDIVRWGDCNGTVIFEDGAYLVKHIGYAGYTIKEVLFALLLPDEYNQPLEVIGNIYENPELLK